eukprot:764541-Hanusia_phi.AAC.1
MGMKDSRSDGEGGKEVVRGACKGKRSIAGKKREQRREGRGGEEEENNLFPSRRTMRSRTSTSRGSCAHCSEEENSTTSSEMFVSSPKSLRLDRLPGHRAAAGEGVHEDRGSRKGEGGAGGRAGGGGEDGKDVDGWWRVVTRRAGEERRSTRFGH